MSFSKERSLASEVYPSVQVVDIQLRSDTYQNYLEDWESSAECKIRVLSNYTAVKNKWHEQL